MNKQTILLFYLSKRRDTFALVLLKYLLERYGPWDVRLYRIDSEPYVFRLIKYYRPVAVIIMDVKAEAQIAILNEAPRFGYRVFLLPTEMQTSHEAGRHLYTADRGRMQRIDRFLSPGAAMKDFLVTHQVLPEDRVPIVGMPRYDYYAPPFSTALQIDEGSFRARYRLTEPLPVVLWASNNRLYAVQSAADRVAKKALVAARYRLNKFHEVYDLDEWIDTWVASHDESLRHIEDLLKRFGHGIYFFYRPRQNEAVDPYVPFFSRFPNARLVPDEHLGNLLAHADLVFHGFSLLGSEAWMFQKPTVSYCFHGLDRYYFDAFRGCEDVVTCRDELHAFVERFLAEGYAAPQHRRAQERFLEQWYYRIDGHSTARAASTIHTALNGASGVSSRGSDPAAAILPWPDRAKFALKRALGMEDFAPLNPAARRRMRGPNAHITRQDVARWSALFGDLLRDHQMTRPVGAPSES